MALRSQYNYIERQSRDAGGMPHLTRLAPDLYSTRTFTGPN